MPFQQAVHIFNTCIFPRNSLSLLIVCAPPYSFCRFSLVADYVSPASSAR
jgi:hypothetical protein